MDAKESPRAVGAVEGAAVSTEDVQQQDSTSRVGVQTALTIRYSRGTSKYDNRPEQRKAADFDAFAEAMLADRSPAKGMTYICAAFAEGSHSNPEKNPGLARWRQKHLVQPRAFLPFDIDEATPEADAKLLKNLARYKGFAYRTASHTSDAPRLRIVLAQSRETGREEGIALCTTVQARTEKELGTELKFDASVYKAEQPLYCPPLEAEVFFFAGRPVDVDAVLAGAQVAPVTGNRLEQIETNDPMLRMLNKLGMVRADCGGGKVRVECPFKAEHSSDGGDGETVYYLAHTNGFALPHFHCLHAHCAKRSDHEYRAAMFARYTKVFGRSPSALPEKPKGDGLRLVSAAEMIRKAGLLNWLIRDYLEADTLAQLFGPAGSFKSFIALDIAVAVASGGPWHGHTVALPGPVVYVCGEGHNGVARRLMAACRERGIDPETLPLVFSSAAVGLTDAENAARLKEAIDALDQPPVLIVVDTLARNFGSADENSTADMNRFVAHIDALRGGATVLIVHHSGHTNQERERGSSALRGAVDANYRIEFDEGLHIVHFVPLKMKDAELPPPMFLTPRVVELPLQDEEGRPATSVVLEAGEDQHVARVVAFFKKCPNLAKGNRRQYLATLLETIHDEPEISQKALARKLKVPDSRISETVKEMRGYALLEAAGLRLTKTGMEATAVLVRTRPDIVFKLFKPRWEPLKGPFRQGGTVPHSGQPEHRRNGER